MIRKWIAVLTLLTLLAGVCAAEGTNTDVTKAEWYSQALLDAEMSLGNNARLKKVIEKASAGEHVTLAVIGGSITEGAGASAYPECWARRFGIRFGTAYGTDSGANVHLVNAGVGGTGSPFGYLRYQREVVDRVPAEDADGLPDVVVIEFSVNDWQEPTNHRCFESMVREILDAPNEPAVILLFAVFRTGFNLQDDLRKIGDRYQLMMVSIKDGIFGRIGRDLSAEEFFFDEYHPTSLGHRIMADCLMQCIGDAAAAETAEAPDLNVKPVYGTDFMPLRTVFGDTESDDAFTIDRGGFKSIDFSSYHNTPVGWVCGKNFYHNIADPTDPLRITGVFRKCLVAWKASPDSTYGTAQILVDGKVTATIHGGPDKWGQSEVVLALDDREAAEHTLEIRLTQAGRRFTITAIGFR